MKSVNDFSFLTVEGPVLPEIAKEVITLWHESAHLPLDVAEKRLNELVLLARYKNGPVIGVSTAVKTFFPQIHNCMYAYRCYIHPEYRAPALDTQMIVRTKNFLEQISKTETVNKSVGLMIIIQNEVIKTNWKQAVWPGADMIYVGNTSEGHHIRVGYFKGALI